MQATVPNESFFITGGTLPTDATCYVVRQADDDLFHALQRGEYCYVLTTRQMGKSSLMVRMAERLRAESVRVVALDMTSIGQNLTVEQWYLGLLAGIGEQLDLHEELFTFWRENRSLGPLQKWLDALRRVVLTRQPAARIVLFIDEIDAVRSLPFAVDEFFAGIRECFNRRAQDIAFQRLTFCLLGVATPSDLIRDSRMSPFNIGRRVVLTDFTLAEAALLANGLRSRATGDHRRDSQQLLSRIYYWTGGHPYMTQRLCRAVAEYLQEGPPPDRSDGNSIRNPISRSQNLVDRICEGLFLSRDARETDDNLAFARNRLLQGGADLAGLLDLYNQVRGGRPVKDDETNPLCSLLRLSGVVRSEHGELVIRNRIYEHVFDRSWVRTHMPDAEQRRQRRAYTRGALRTAAVTGTVALVMTTLAMTAFYQAAEARHARDEARQRSRDVAAERDHARDLNTRLEQALRAEKVQHGRADTQAMAARKATVTAETRRTEAEHARAEALRQGRLATARLGRLDLAAGVRLMDEGDMLSALPQLVEAMRLDGDNPERTQMHRLRLSAVLESAPHLLRVWFGRGAVRSAEFSPEGRRVVLADAAGGVRVWDVDTDSPLTPEMKHSRTVNNAAFSPDGRRLVTSCDDGAARVWDSVTGRRLCMLRHTAPVVYAAWSPDGTRIATAMQGQCILWNVAAQNAPPKPIATVEMTGGRPTRVAFSPDGDRLAVVSENFQGFTVDTRRGEDGVSLAACYVGHHVEFSADGRRVLVAGVFGRQGEEKGAAVFDARTGRPVLPVLRHRLEGIDARFSPNGERIVTTGRDQTVRVWDARTGSPITPPIEHRAPVMAAAFSPDGRRIVTAGADGVAHIWNAGTGEPVAPPMKQAGPLITAAFDRRGDRVLTAGSDGTARLWSATTSAIPHRAAGLYHALRVHRRLPDGRILAIETKPPDRGSPAARNRSLTLIVPETGARRTVCALRPDARPEAEAFTWASLSRDGRRLAFVEPEGARVVDTQTFAVLLRGVPCVHSALSPDGRVLLVQGSDHRAQFWSVAERRPLGRAFPRTRWDDDLSGERAPFSPNGRMAAIIEPQGTVTLRDCATGRPVAHGLVHTAAVEAALFTPDGRFLFTWTEAGDVNVWSVRPDRQGHCVCTGRCRQDGGYRLSTPLLVNADGSRALTPSQYNQGFMTLWDLTSGRPLSTARLPSDLRATFSPDGRLFMTVASAPTVWDARTGRLVARAPVEWAVNGALFAPDSRRILTLGADGIARVWDAATGRALTSPMNHPRSVTAGAFSPDGRLAATVCEDGAVRLWDSGNGEQVSPPLRQSGRIQEAEFLRTNDRLITYDAGEVRAWKLPYREDSMERLTWLSELLSGQRVDLTLGLVSATPGQIRYAWRHLQASSSRGR